MSNPDSGAQPTATTATSTAEVIAIAKLIFEGLTVLMAIYKIVEPGFVQALADFRKLFEGGTVTQADIDALMARFEDQAARIQAP